MSYRHFLHGRYDNPKDAGQKDELTKRTRSLLRAIQRSPERVRAYFTPRPARYAA